MIKTTQDGRFYAACDPSKTFATEGEAAVHRSMIRRRGEATRPDSRDVRQRMADDSFAVPMAENPGRFDSLKASLQRDTDAGSYSPKKSRGERLLHSIRSMEQRDHDAEDAAEVAAEWNSQPLVQAGLREANRILAECEDDFTRDRAEVAAAERLIACLQTPGADTAHIQRELRNLLGVESKRLTDQQLAANAELNAALGKVQQLQAAERATVQVPVSGETLAERGNSYVNNLMASEASHAQIDDAFAALDKFYAGDASALEAALATNGGANDSQAA